MSSSVQMQEKVSARDWQKFFLLGTLWGGSFLFIALALEAFTPAQVAFSRVTIAGVILALWRIFDGNLEKFLALPWKHIFVLGLINNAAPYFLISSAQQEITSGVAAILNSFTPLAGVIFAHYFLHDEPMTKARALSILLGVFGVALVVMPQEGFQFSGVEFNILELGAQAMMLGAALCYAASGVYVRRVGLGNHNAIDVASGQLLVAALFLLPILGNPLEAFALPATALQNGLIGILGLAIFSTVIAYPMFFSLLTSMGAGRALMVTQLMPAVSLILGAVVLNETLDMLDLLGMGFIALALYGANHLAKHKAQ